MSTDPPRRPRGPSAEFEALVVDMSVDGTQPWRRVLSVLAREFVRMWNGMVTWRQCVLLGTIFGVCFLRFGLAAVVLPVTVFATPVAVFAGIVCLVNALVAFPGLRGELERPAAGSRDVPGEPSR